MFANSLDMKTAILASLLSLIAPLVMTQSSDKYDYYLLVGTYTNEGKTNGSRHRKPANKRNDHCGANTKWQRTLARSRLTRWTLGRR